MNNQNSFKCDPKTRPPSFLLMRRQRDCARWTAFWISVLSSSEANHTVYGQTDTGLSSNWTPRYKTLCLPKRFPLTLNSKWLISFPKVELALKNFKLHSVELMKAKTMTKIQETRSKRDMKEWFEQKRACMERCKVSGEFIGYPILIVIKDEHCTASVWLFYRHISYVPKDVTINTFLHDCTKNSTKMSVCLENTEKYHMQTTQYSSIIYNISSSSNFRG